VLGCNQDQQVATAENMLERLPSTHNGDLAYRLREMVQLSAGTISWEALSSSIALCASLYARWRDEQRVELLWAGPAPAGGTPARRIDQVLYPFIRPCHNLLIAAQHLLALSITTICWVFNSGLASSKRRFWHIPSEASCDRRKPAKNP
jgi:hypothetical protein